MSTVKVIKSQTSGKVLNISKNNPLEGWVMVESVDTVFKGGRLFENRRTGFLRQQVSVLESLSLAGQFAKLGITDIPVLQPKGFAEGQVLPGRVVIQDQLVPIMPANVEFGKRIPQNGNTPAIRKAVRDAATLQGLTYQAYVTKKVTDPETGEVTTVVTNELATIYRKTFYSPYPEGHASYEADSIITPSNLDQVNAFIASVTASLSKPATGTGNAKEVRLAELKAMGKAKRVAAGVQEEYEALLDD